MIYILICLFVLHFLFVFLLLAGLEKAFSRIITCATKSANQFISVIVPFRNESKNLARVIESLKLQRCENFEVILVDDHSTDESFRMAALAIDHDSRFTLIKAIGEGKKSAITDAILAAKGSIIATTDADCSMGPEWLNSIEEAFYDSGVKLAFGAVRITDDETFFTNIQALEFDGVIATGIAAHGLNHPVYCNGANLAFQKEIFLEVKGYEGNRHIPSGDDEFLLKKVKALFPSGIRFLNKRDSLVSTLPQDSVREFIQQRIRWAGKWRQGSDAISKLMAILVLCVQIATLGSVITLILGKTSPFLLLMLLGLKTLTEYFFLFRFSRLTNASFSIINFFLLQLIYPFYVIYIGVMCNFSDFEWKGRKLKPASGF